MRKLVDFLENLVIVAIVLVLAHTFIEDYALLAGWTVAARKWVIWSGLGFDIFFTIEFFTRLYVAISRGESGEYFFHRSGWIDFLASVPLLLLNSLPNTLALVAGSGLLFGLGGMLNVLKVIKAVRITRILRLMRVIKLFRGARYSRSPMAQRHITSIITISVTILVFWMLASSLLGVLGVGPGIEASLFESQKSYVSYVMKTGSERSDLARRAAEVAPLEPTLLQVKDGTQVVWTRYDSAYNAAHFLPGDYGYFERDGVGIFLDERPYQAGLARESMVFFIAILLIVLAYIFIYAPRFASLVTDPINAMRRGMSDADYNRPVAIPSDHAEEDVFRLARLYNKIFLPSKRSPAEREAETGRDCEKGKD